MSKKMIAEAIGTFILVFFGCGSAVLMGAEIGMHGIALAFGLAIVAAAYVGINVTSVSVNPARSFGPAIFGGGKAMADLWLFFAAPLAGGALAGILHGAGVTHSAHTLRG